MKVRGNKQQNMEWITIHTSFIQLQKKNKQNNNKQLKLHTVAAASCDSRIRTTSSPSLHCST